MRYVWNTGGVRAIRNTDLANAIYIYIYKWAEISFLPEKANSPAIRLPCPGAINKHCGKIWAYRRPPWTHFVDGLDKKRDILSLAFCKNNGPSARPLLILVVHTVPQMKHHTASDQQWYCLDRRMGGATLQLFFIQQPICHFRARPFVPFSFRATGDGQRAQPRATGVINYDLIRVWILKIIFGIPLH